MNFLGIAATPGAQELMSWMGCLAFLVGICVGLKTLFWPSVPQPMRTKSEAEFVERRSYEVHCRINREEHARIEAELRGQLREIEEKHNVLSREVSSVGTLAETTEAQLVQINTKLENIWREMPKTRKA